MKNRIEKLASYIILGVVIITLMIGIDPNWVTSTENEQETSLRLNQISSESEENVSDRGTKNMGNTFKECKNTGIRYLIDDYYEAYLDPKDDRILKYIDTYGDFDETKRAFIRKNVEQYMGTRCYYMEGLIQDSYLVVSYSYVKYFEINTAVPYMEMFFVRKNSSGNYYICNSEISNEITVYNSIMFSNRQVQEMRECALYELNSACEVDSVLAEFVEKNKDYFDYMK
ncbi:MAG: hypothetical protein ACI4AQ_04750 [Lachnospiraceae bacterium]